MRTELIRRACRGAAAGVLGVCAAGVLLELLLGRAVAPAGAFLLERFGLRAGLLLELLASALWGMELFTAPLLWRMERLPFWGRMALHFTVTVLGFTLWALPHADSPYWGTASLLAGLAAGVYLLVWSVNWMGSRRDAERIRERLGLPEAEGTGRGPFQVRAALPYLVIAAVVELMLPPLLRLADAPDVPVLTGLLYPFLFLPFACFTMGLDIGKRFGVALLIPAACGLLTIPHIFWLYNYTALFQAWTAGGAALLGNLLGALWRKCRKKK